jgi:hypothetical protein
MKVKVTTTFKWSPDGNSTHVEREGSVVEGAAAIAAVAMGCGAVLVDETPPPAPEEKKAAPPPSNKAVGAAPRNKGR